MVKFDINKLRKKKTQREKELLKLMADENISSSLISRPESYPDFAGQILSTVGDALFTAMYENECETIEELFKPYFRGSLLEFEKLKPEETGSDRRSQTDLKIAVSPLLDLMDMSGYAYLFSDYHDAQGLKNPIVKTWDNYLNQDSATSRLRFLAATISLSGSVFGTVPRDQNRGKWMQMIRQRLSDVERQELPPTPGRRTVQAYSDTVPVHKSPLVVIFAGHFSFWDGIDIFIAQYVRQREGGENLDFGHLRRRDLREEIRKVERHAARNEQT